MAGAAMSLPAPDAACVRLGRHYCQTSSTLLVVMAAPLIKMTFIRAVHTPPDFKHAVKIPQAALSNVFFVFFDHIELVEYLLKWQFIICTRYL